MLIDIRSMTGQPGTSLELDLQVSREMFGLQQEDLSLASPVEFAGRLQHTGHGILVLTGHASASFVSICARCLKPVPLTVQTDVRETFEPTNDLPDNGEEQPGETYGYTGHKLDIGQALRDNLIPLLPARVICKDDCAGICPVCGADRNENPCDCLDPEKGRQGPFDALKQLL